VTGIAVLHSIFVWHTSPSPAVSDPQIGPRARHEEVDLDRIVEA
jgi:hypothetical protein